MRLLDRYLLVEWLKAFGLALGATLAVLLLGDLYNNINDLIAAGAHPREVIFYYRELLPSFLPAVLPLSQLVSLLYVLGNLHRHNEIIAMRAAGLSLWRVARPVWIAGAVLAVMLGLLDAYAVPRAIEQARTFRDNLRHAAERRKNPAEQVGIVPQLTYDNPAENRRWFMNRFSDDSYRGFGIHVYQLDDRGHDQRHILARDGYFDPGKGYWILRQGRELFFDANGGGVVRSLPFEEKAFPELTEKPATMLTLRQRANDLSVNELKGALAHTKSGTNHTLDTYAVQYYAILAKPFICLIVVGLAVPFAVAGVRINPMVGTSKAVGLFFVNYVVTGLCTHLGNQHILPAFLAAWLPIFLALGFVLWLFRRAA